ncbi:hypothetical protein [Cardiobacterium hominis]|jgi:hypothetical protein|uniref:hypothetical protein n=1 Tax=Cardiobacterium hominis TaxID=2718 RepID=UPI0028D0D260|nr:hypothetical protein [Cardiobacterium hominis]
MQHFSAQPDGTAAITPYTQDDYRRLCERLDDDTVAALLHAHIDAFAADGNRQLLKRLTEAMHIAAEFEQAGRNGHPDSEEQTRRAYWDCHFAALQQHARMAGNQITNADNAAVSRLTRQCEKNGSCDTAIPSPHDDDYGFAAALRDIPLNEKQTALLWRMALLTIAEMMDAVPSLVAHYLNGIGGEHLGRALAGKTVYPVTVVSNLAWLLHEQQKSGQLQRDLWHSAAALGSGDAEVREKPQ